MVVDGRRTPIISGEFHYWRLPAQHLWRDVLEKMKATGFNTVSLYFHWGYHSQERGVFDFSGVRDVDLLLQMAEEVGLYVIARPGPYIQAETSMGGFPPYLSTYAGLPRVGAADNLAAELEWLAAVDRIIARHQLTDGGGTVIAHQIENEMFTPFTGRYLNTLAQAVRANGITVPLFHNDYGPGHGWYAPGKPGGESLQLYAFDFYPLLFSCAGARARLDTHFERRVRRYSPSTPVFIAEGQGGAFTPWGASHQADDCARFVDDRFTRQFTVNNLANGVTMHNTYMQYGGTNWGWTGDPSTGFTSYDYGAPIAENRTLRGKAVVQKEFAQLQRAVPALAATRAVGRVHGIEGPDRRRVLAEWRQAEDGPTRLLTLRHRHSNDERISRFSLPLTVDGHTYRRVPQKEEASVVLNGRDALALVVDHQVGPHRIQYTTAQLAGSTVSPGRATATFTAPLSQESETVLRLAVRPEVIADRGIETHWDQARHELRINAVHQGIGRVTLRSVGEELSLIFADRAAYGQIWHPDLSVGGSIRVAGVDLVRSAIREGTTIVLRGDTAAASRLQVDAPAGVTSLTWNGTPVPAIRDAFGALVADLPGPRPTGRHISLDTWVGRESDPERLPEFDDRTWTPLTKKKAANLLHGPGPAQRIVMTGEDYGFDHGDLWYRGTFTPHTSGSTVTVSARTGRHGMAMVWVNGIYVGSQGDGPRIHQVPREAMRRGEPAKVAILVRNNGHPVDGAALSLSKHGRGLWDVAFPGAGRISWKMQGAIGGRRPVDVARGAYNNGGLFGERQGWHLPQAPAAGFVPVAGLNADRPGVRWYRTAVRLDLPGGQDTPVSLRVDDVHFRQDRYRAIIFVNGWLTGNYINHVGPQQEFVVPGGFLRAAGENEISVVIESEDAGVGPDRVSLLIGSGVLGGPSQRTNPALSYGQLFR
ncbi:putative beta-galactosidase [Austwickia chelonae NBRC 105200]|uniref:beta-galactosidase n=1 Tax=Austwickia chelonae NBRC 105200 TaxID=1184607 RepID=K6V5F0_9MICO|nr:putative beta-galactosidase [Austwickia chelonae NBRC 105200]